MRVEFDDVSKVLAASEVYCGIQQSTIYVSDPYSSQMRQTSKVTQLISNNAGTGTQDCLNPRLILMAIIFYCCFGCGIVPGHGNCSITVITVIFHIFSGHRLVGGSEHSITQ